MKTSRRSTTNHSKLPRRISATGATCYGAKRSRLEPLKEFVKSVEEHWAGIISWHASRISNGLLEGTNSLIQAAKARARGYRSKRKIAITYLIAGKLPTPSPFVTHTM